MNLTVLRKLKKVVLAVILALTIGSQSSHSFPVWAHEAGVQEAAADASHYNLTESIQAAVKSASVEKTPDGNRLSVTVRLYNSSLGKARIPTHELRVMTTGGAEYKLDASIGNKGVLKPMEVAELTFMSIIDSSESIQLSGLSFVAVDEYMYPKTETMLLEVPLEGRVWNGVNDQGRLSIPNVTWNQSFTIAGINSSLQYTPVSYSKQSVDQGTSSVVTLLVENKGAARESLPDFRLDALSEQKQYVGKRTSQEQVQLEAGEKQFIHYAIPVDKDTNLNKLLVMTFDTFDSSAAQSTKIDVGRISLDIPEGNVYGGAYNDNYQLGTPIAIDQLYQITENTDISLMELHVQHNSGEGYQTAIGKFVITNKSDKAVPMPVFDTELIGGDGASYSGLRQVNAAQTLNPGLSYVVSFVFHLPQTETGREFILRLLDSKTASPYQVTIASLPASVQKDTEADEFMLYPFSINIENVTVGTNYVSTNQTYSYKLKLSLGIKQAENVVVDQGTSKLHFEVVDKLGRVLGTASTSFTGPQKLVSGTQLIVTSNIQSEQFEYPVSVQMYELIETANGQGKRYLKTIHY